MLSDTENAIIKKKKKRCTLNDFQLPAFRQAVVHFEVFSPLWQRGDKVQ